MNARIAADSAVASLLGMPVRLSLRLAEPHPSAGAPLDAQPAVGRLGSTAIRQSGP